MQITLGLFNRREREREPIDRKGERERERVKELETNKQQQQQWRQRRRRSSAADSTIPSFADLTRSHSTVWTRLVHSHSQQQSTHSKQASRQASTQSGSQSWRCVYGQPKEIEEESRPVALKCKNREQLVQLVADDGSHSLAIVAITRQATMTICVCVLVSV